MADVNLTMEEVLAELDAAITAQKAAAERFNTLANRLRQYALDYLLDDPTAVADLRLAAELLDQPKEEQ